MTKLLNNAVVAQVKEVFDKELKNPVEILFFGRKTDCDYCGETRQLLEEVAAISDQISFSGYDLDETPDVAAQYRVDKAPVTVIAAREAGGLVDYGIRFAGIPSGHEFSSLIHTILLVSSRDSGLSPKVRAELKTLERPVHLQVFVTPT